MATADSPELFSNVLLLVASEEGARHTARLLAPYKPGRVTALYVDRGASSSGGDPSTTDDNEGVVSAIRDVFPDAEFETLFSDNVAEMLRHKANDIDASAIVFGRGAGGSSQFFTGNRTHKLVSHVKRPVVVFPAQATP